MAGKWLDRFQAEGFAGLEDRFSRPHRLRKPTPEAVCQRIVELRRRRWTGKQIAQEVQVSPATVNRVLRRAGLSRLKDLDPPEKVCRYEREQPGELIHIDIKKLGRFRRPDHRVAGDRTRQSSPRSKPRAGYGWEYVHVCIDDHSRVTFSQFHPNQKAYSAVAFLKAAIAYYYRSLGIKGDNLRRLHTYSVIAFRGSDR